MRGPSSTLFNYSAMPVSVQSLNKITALIDLGFRNYTLRSFKLSGIQPPDPRSRPSGKMRETYRADIEARRTFLEEVLRPGGKARNVMISPEKPTYAGNFSAGLFLPIKAKVVEDPYIIRHDNSSYLSLNALIRHLANGGISIDTAKEAIDRLVPVAFNRSSV